MQISNAFAYLITKHVVKNYLNVFINRRKDFVVCKQLCKVVLDVVRKTRKLREYGRARRAFTVDMVTWHIYFVRIALAQASVHYRARQPSNTLFILHVT